jgi:phage-related minor tail protein
MSNATTNGRLPRKQLGDQLDRLDSILDGLSDALNEAVADAAREGAKSAVKEILMELLTNPQFAGLSRQAAPAPAATPAAEPVPAPTSAAKPSLRSRLIGSLKERVSGFRKTVVEWKTGIVTRLHALVSSGKSAVKPVGSVLDVLRLAGNLRKSLWVAAGAGVAVGLASLACPHWASAVISAAGGTVIALALRAGNAVRVIFARFRLA